MPKEFNPVNLIRSRFLAMKSKGEKNGKYVSDEQLEQAMNDLDIAIERTKQESFAFCRYRDQKDAEMEQQRILFGDDPDLALDEDESQNPLEKSASKNSSPQQMNNKKYTFD